MNVIERFKLLPKSSKRLLSFGIIMALVVALPLFLWAIQNLNFNPNKRASSGEPGACTTYLPEFSVTPEFQHGNPGQTLSYRVSIRLNDSSIDCPNRVFRIEAFLPTDVWGYQTDLPNDITIGARSSVAFDVRIASPSQNYTLGNHATDFRLVETNNASDQTIRVYYVLTDAILTPTPSSIPTPTPSMTPGATGTPTPSATSTAIPTPTRKPLTFRVRFGGVSDGAADRAKAAIRFVSGFINVITPAIEFRHTGGGVYEATISPIGYYLPFMGAGNGYTIYVKGEKHISNKFCRMVGQVGPCLGAGNIPVPEVTAEPVSTYDFTGYPLEPGDLPLQDGVANGSDFAKLKALLSRPCSDLTNIEKLTADLDYNGCVNIRDAFLLRKTLETRYDDF